MSCLLNMTIKENLKNCHFEFSDDCMDAGGRVAPGTATEKSAVKNINKT